MADQFGLTPEGFVAPRQAQILSDLQQAFQNQFGATVNLSSSTVFGQIVNIFSEREALLWEALQDDVVNSTPAGAQGIYVDNLLSLVGLSRLPAQATVTNPTPATQPNGITLFGLVLTGTPGTVVPKGALIQTASQPVLTFALDNAVTISGAVNAVQDLYFTAQATSGSLVLGLEAPDGASFKTQPIPFNALLSQTIIQAAAPTTGTYKIALDDLVTDEIGFAADASAIQAFVRKLAGFEQAVVSGSWPKLLITWGTSRNPIVTLQDNIDASVTQSVTARVQALKSSTSSVRPFTDAVVTAPSSGQWRISYGAGLVAAGQKTSGAQPQALVSVASNTLLAGNTAVNIGVTSAVTGRAAQGVGTASCTKTGAYPVPAGALSVIGSSQQGWAGVTNQLDALVGRDVESDSEAMARRGTLLSSPGAGPLAATLSRLQRLDGVTQAIGFQNLTAAALQRVTFLVMPTSGTYSLSFSGSTTGTLPYNATAAQLQTALDALPQSPSCTVTGAYSYGFALDFGGALGGQALPLVTVASDTTGGQLRTSFGRPPKSVEYVVQGGADDAIADAILQASAGGIATYGAPVLETTGSTLAGSQVVQLASVSNVIVGEAIFAQGLTPGSIITGVTGTQVTLNLPALSTLGSVPVTINHTLVLKDAGGNPMEVSFTRPKQVPVYLRIALTTDIYNTPGVPSSGPNSNSVFDPASLQSIEASVIDAVNAVKIGGLLTLRGTSGLGSAFRNTPGIVDVDLAFDVVPGPTSNASIRMLADQVPRAEAANTQVLYT